MKNTSRSARVIDLPIEKIRAMKDEAVAKAKAANMKDEALNARAFALQDVLAIKEQRERRK